MREARDESNTMKVSSTCRITALLLAAHSLCAHAGVPVHTFASLSISPDGTRLASIEGSRSFESVESSHAAIVVRRVRDGSIVQRIDPCSACSYGDLAWSADGKLLAFLASQAGLAEVMIDRDGHDSSIASIKGIANTLRFSPDGKSIAMLATLSPKKKTGALEAGAQQVGDIGASPDEQRIAVVPIGGGMPAFASPPDTFVYEYDWTPDGGGFIGTAAKGDGDDNWWLAELDAFERASATVRTIAKNDWARYQMAVPRISPDGSKVVFIGGIMSDFGPVAGEIYEVPFSGGTPRSLTPEFRGSFNGLIWRKSRLLATGILVDRAALLAIGAADKPSVSTLWSAEVTALAEDGSVSLSADGRTGASVVEDFGHAPRIIAGPIGRMAAVSRDNDGLAVDLETRSVRWRNEGFEVQGWLIGPSKRPAGKLYPMIVHVHGGPSAAVLPIFGTD